MSDEYDPELDLLGDDAQPDASSGPAHAFKTAPIFTGDAFGLLGPSVLPQRALYGRILGQHAPNFPEAPVSPKLYINTNAPFSAVVCGVQGSGKSHSTSVLLESCLMADRRLGTLPEPLSALVFHFDTAAGGGAVQPCEAAYLASVESSRGGEVVPPDVTVLVLPANLQAMKQVYAGLPSVKVEPLRFSADDISGERLLAMMKVDDSNQMPLYMEAIMSILRSMESRFNYQSFRQQLKEQKLNPSQKAMLNLRLSLLDSCLQGGNNVNRVATHFRKGQLTIVDLSSPFMDASSACGFFDMILGLFVEADLNAAGKLVVLDEAHKYLSDTQTGTSARLTESLLSVIRQQRHLATRVVVSTQEPTVVPPKFLDLCSFIIAHRFSSPKWLRLLTEHISMAGEGFDELFSRIASLGTGQAILFAPNGLSARGLSNASSSSSDTGDSGISIPEDAGTVAPLVQGYLLVRSRQRVTRDGGHSILAVQDPESTTRLPRAPFSPSSQASVPSASHDGGWGTPYTSPEDWKSLEPAAAVSPSSRAAESPKQTPVSWAAEAWSKPAAPSWAAQPKPLRGRGRGKNLKAQGARGGRAARAAQGWGSTGGTASSCEWGTNPTQQGSSSGLPSAAAAASSDEWGAPLDDGWGPEHAASADPEPAGEGSGIAADSGAWGVEPNEPAKPPNENSKFRDLIQYMFDKKEMGTNGVTVSDIDGWFSTELVDEAVKKNFLQYVPTASRPKVTLAPDTNLADFQ
ncbi:hypothetical protein PsYK624_042420 [Phanerochaete sordida]|uniref:Uncharacterized protein n=1 Tax=Phanerochaete sordida TaxID=48140 RepID=A0A9P3G621_9APHY|nr:hypothetical protein PsYK624_042420 [Phanerochaete sordida]